MTRSYLDWNATTPLRAEARAAMLSAMDVVGNPSSVHAEGRAARAIVERARAQVAAALGAGDADIIFTSGASEAAALAMVGADGQSRGWAAADIEHEAVLAWRGDVLVVDGQGRVDVIDPTISALQLANSETGILQDLPAGLALSDLTQAFGKLAFGFDWLGVVRGIVSAHKLGGPKGIGALVVRRGVGVAPQIRGAGKKWASAPEPKILLASQALVRRPKLRHVIWLMAYGTGWRRCATAWKAPSALQPLGR